MTHLFPTSVPSFNTIALITSEIYWIKLGLCEGYDFEKTRSNALPEIIANFSVYVSAHALRLLHERARLSRVKGRRS